MTSGATVLITSTEHGNSADLLVFDIGNSATHIGLWTGGDLRVSTAVRHEDFASIDEVIAEHWRALQHHPRAVACSVVPHKLVQLHERVLTITSERLLVVGQDLPVPVGVKIESPETLGIDRLCGAAAAYQIHGQACAVVDAGSAITIDCVDDDGNFIGGVILPGLNLQASSLASHTAALPLVTVAQVASPMAQSTEGAIQAGILFGSIGAIKHIVELFASELGRWPPVVLAGGDASLLAGSAEFIDTVVPDLCLRGVVLAYHKSLGPGP